MVEGYRVENRRTGNKEWSRFSGMFLVSGVYCTVVSVSGVDGEHGETVAQFHDAVWSGFRAVQSLALPDRAVAIPASIDNWGSGVWNPWYVMWTMHRGVVRASGRGPSWISLWAIGDRIGDG